jgi:hypothetical protein
MADPEKEQTMTIHVLVPVSVICLAVVVGTQGLTAHPSVAQTTQPATMTETPKQRITTSKDQLSGTLAPDTIKALASQWDGTKLAAPLKLSECADCPDAATRKALAAASVLRSLRDIKKSDNGQFHVTGADGGQMSISDEGQIEISPANNIKFDRTLCYVVEFERGQAKITVAVRGTDETREVVMMHIRPVAPAAFEPVTLGKFEPWIWKHATTW